MGNTLYNIKQLQGNNLLSFDERIIVKIKPSKRETSKKKKKPQMECRLSSLILYGDKVGQKKFFWNIWNLAYLKWGQWQQQWILVSHNLSGSPVSSL